MIPRHAKRRLLLSRNDKQACSTKCPTLFRLRPFWKVCFPLFVILIGFTGRCRAEDAGQNCPYRHCVYCHPERIALLFLHNQLTPLESGAWMLIPCSSKEVNPFSSPREKLCYDFLNTGVCKRNQEGKICRFRHCLPNHEEAVKDRMKKL